MRLSYLKKMHDSDSVIDSVVIDTQIEIGLLYRLLCLLYASQSSYLVSLSYQMAAFSTNPFGLF